MSTELEPPLDGLAHWLNASDCHAAYHLPLLDRAQHLLAGSAQATEPQRHELAGQLERWRYQHLNERYGRLSGEDRSLVDALDLTANALAGRPQRPPRWPRAAIQNGQFDRPAIHAALAGLRAEVPLEDICREATRLTEKHFSASPCRGGAGPRRRMLLYAPIYLSNHCINHCVYCGFRHPEQIERRHLSLDEALGQAAILRPRGFEQMLLVSGDFPRLTTTRYHAEIIRALSARGICVSMEIAPQTTASYAALAAAGACGVTLYQETFDESLYASYHPRGSKTSYDWRLEGPERAAEAGVRRLGLGFLLGLADPTQDLLALMRHGAYLQDRFPDCTLAFSLPRIREAPRGFQPPYPVGDELFLRMYCALRLAFPRAELVLSTRELAPLRDRLAAVCITQISAGSSTAPGGYSGDAAAASSGQQFPVCDHRSAEEMAASLQRAGLEVTWR